MFVLAAFRPLTWTLATCLWMVWAFDLFYSPSILFLWNTFNSLKHDFLSPQKCDGLLESWTENQIKPFKVFETKVHLMLGFLYQLENQIVHSVIKSSPQPRSRGCQGATLKTLCFYLHFCRLLGLHIYPVSQSSGLLRAKISLLKRWSNLWVTAFTFVTAAD